MAQASLHLEVMDFSEGQPSNEVRLAGQARVAQGVRPGWVRGSGQDGLDGQAEQVGWSHQLQNLV